VASKQPILINGRNRTTVRANPGRAGRAVINYPHPGRPHQPPFIYGALEQGKGQIR
jgi:hypothetical protein